MVRGTKRVDLRLKSLSVGRNWLGLGRGGAFYVQSRTLREDDAPSSLALRITEHVCVLRVSGQESRGLLLAGCLHCNLTMMGLDSSRLYE